MMTITPISIGTRATHSSGAQISIGIAHIGVDIIILGTTLVGASHGDGVVSGAPLVVGDLIGVDIMAGVSAWIITLGVAIMTLIGIMATIITTLAAAMEAQITVC